MVPTTFNVQSLSSSKNIVNSKIPVSQTPTRRNKNIQKSNEDLTRRPKLNLKNTFGSTGSLNTKTSSHENVLSKKLNSNKNTLSDSNLNRSHITKRNAVKAQPLQSSVENIVKPEPIGISFSNEVITTVQIPELTKDEAEYKLEELLTLINRIEDKKKMEFPDEKMIQELKNQCYRIIFKNTTAEKWITYFQNILNEFNIEEKKIEEQGAKLMKDFQDNIRQINELEGKALIMKEHEENLINFKTHLLGEENRYKTEIDNYEVTCQEIFTQFNNSLENCVFTKFKDISDKINDSLDKFTKSSLERYQHMETLINKFKHQ
uniref:Col_cuticle_N domain-containing protein n=1 Tax=Strongyloides stercoralis TaxID=6248 RepID=A0A0K0ECQ6_STRER